AGPLAKTSPRWSWTVRLLRNNRAPPSPDPRRSGLGRADVLVEREEVVRVVLTLHLGEPVEGRGRVGASNALLPLVAKEADIGRGGAIRERRRQAARPGLMLWALLRAVIHRGDVHHQPRPPVAERRGVVGDARHRAAEHAELDDGYLGGGGVEVLEDRPPRPGDQAIDEHVRPPVDRLPPALLINLRVADRAD